MSESLKVLFITDLYEPYVGGATTHLKGIATRLVRRGHSVHVLTTRMAGYAKREELHGVMVERIGPANQYGRYLFGISGTVRASACGSTYDVIHGSTFVAAGLTSFVGRFARRLEVLTVYEVFDAAWAALLPQTPLRAELLRRLEVLSLRAPHERLVAISEYTANRLRKIGIGPSKIKVIHSGVDYEFWSTTSANPGRFREKYHLGNRFVYCSYGRAGISKGFGNLLDAAEMISRALPESRLFLCLNEGGLYNEHIRKIRASNNLRQHVILAHQLPPTELRDALAGSDAIVVPSVSEGFGLTVAESCALGTPVIATRVGAIPEVISGRGRLVQASVPGQLADAILRGASGEWDQFPSRRFPWDVAVDKFEAWLRETPR